jgi:MoaA/NifB/PqqE/SkfB family radical SAM enzyme
LSRNIFKPALKIANSMLRFRIGCPRPFFVSYQITFRCNRKCMFCDAWKLKNPRELDTEQAKRIVGELADGGVGILGITGGEPLIRPDLEEIAAAAKRKGVIIGVNTNGTLLTPTRAKSISTVFDTVFVSLDGFEETHDRIRGEKGTFREAFTGLKNLLSVKGDCVVGVNFVLNNANYKEFIPFCNWIKNLGVFVTVFPVGGEDNLVSAYSIPSNKVDGFVFDVLKEKETNPLIGPSEKVIEFLPRFIRGEMPQICDAGRLYMGVSPLGDLRVCPIAPSSPEWNVGSLVTSSMTELMETTRFRELLEYRKNCKSCLAGCTTPYSLLFRGSAPDLAKEAFTYLRVVRNRKWD